MTYKGDTSLEKFLKASGDTRSIAEIKSVLRGVLAAPEDIADPDRWLTLFKANAEAAEQLTALKGEMEAVQNNIRQDRLADFRAEMAKMNIDGFFVPRADQFQGEYVPACNERLEWATGFTGSAGSAVILKDRAAFFTDGRYTLQARAQVDAKDFDICSISENQSPTPTISPDAWVEKNLPRGARFGVDPWVHTPAGIRRLKDAVEKAGGTLALLDRNPLDAAWQDRPAEPLAPVVPQPLEYAGKSSEDKRSELVAVMKEKGASAIAVMLPEEVCWLLNVRGGDVPCTPFALSYAILNDDATVDWFIDPRKVTDETRKWMGADVRLHDLADVADHLETLAKAGAKIWLDPSSAPLKAQDIVIAGGGKVIAERSPLQLMKAKKNAQEIQGSIDAHIRDGVAMARFIAAISEQGAAAKFDEISASDLLQKFRSEGEKFRGLSFDTISGAGANGAIVHYRSTPETKKPLLAGPIYLVDSGAQYLDGTTDITRTIAVDNVTAEMKEHVTRVLIGHIRVAMATFPEGTTGDKLDVKARSALKEVGLDYAHGTGHGVGSYLSVHEGPCGISPLSTTVPLEPGMIISNEPGFYKEGAYGIRIENLVTVIDTGERNAGGKKMLGFKTLTMAPIDRNLVETSLLTEEELKWFNDYHAEVRKNVLPLVEKIDSKAADFLKQATEPLYRDSDRRPANNKKFCL